MKKFVVDVENYLGEILSCVVEAKDKHAAIRFVCQFMMGAEIKEEFKVRELDGLYEVVKKF